MNAEARKRVKSLEGVKEENLLKRIQKCIRNIRNGIEG